MTCQSAISGRPQGKQEDLVLQCADIWTLSTVFFKHTSSERGSAWIICFSTLSSYSAPFSVFLLELYTFISVCCLRLVNTPIKEQCVCVCVRTGSFVSLPVTDIVLNGSVHVLEHFISFNASLLTTTSRAK